MKYTIEIEIDEHDDRRPGLCQEIAGILSVEAKRLNKWVAEQDGRGVFTKTLSDANGETVGRADAEGWGNER